MSTSPRLEGPKEFVAGEYKTPRLGHVLIIYNWKTRKMRFWDNKELFEMAPGESPYDMELDPEEHMYLASVEVPWLGPANGRTENRMEVIREDWKTQTPQPDVPWAVQIARSIFLSIYDHMPPYSFGPGQALRSGCPTDGTVVKVGVGELNLEIEVREVP